MSVIFLFIGFCGVVLVLIVFDAIIVSLASKTTEISIGSPSGADAAQRTPFLRKGRSLFLVRTKMPNGKWKNFCLGSPVKREAKLFSVILQEIANDLANPKMKSLARSPEYAMTKLNSFFVQCGEKPIDFNLDNKEEGVSEMTLRELNEKFYE